MGKETGIKISQYDDYKEYQRQYYLKIIKPARALQKEEKNNDRSKDSDRI